jgi:hypothetical protein
MRKDEISYLTRAIALTLILQMGGAQKNKTSGLQFRHNTGVMAILGSDMRVIALIFMLIPLMAVSQKQASELEGVWECHSYRDSSGVMGITAARYTLMPDGQGQVDFFDPLAGPFSEYTLMISYEVTWSFHPDTRNLTLTPLDDALIETLTFRVDKFRKRKKLNLYDALTESVEFFSYVR